MASLSPLPAGPKVQAPAVRNAARFLRGAHDSVEGLFDAMQTIANSRRGANATTVGRLNRQEVDLIRSAIVFTSSGLDAAMSRLVNDAGRFLILCPKKTGARSQYEQYLKQEMSRADAVPSALREAVIHPDASTRILDYYLTERTRASLQGSGDLSGRVRNVLGIPSSRIPDSALKALDPFFVARNNIVHSLDYENPNDPKKTKRTERPAEEVATLCDLAFAVCSDFIHATAEVIVASR